MWSYQGGLLGLLILAADVYAIINILQSRDATGTKVLWTVLVLAMPFLGVLLWYFFGPRSKEAL